MRMSFHLGRLVVCGTVLVVVAVLVQLLVVSRVEAQQTVTVSLGSLTYSVSENDTVAVEVTLTPTFSESLTVQVVAAPKNGASEADYEISQTPLIFASGESSKTFMFRAVDDDVHFEDGESVRITFGTLPPNIEAGTIDTTTITIEDSDNPTTADLDGLDVVWESPSADSWGSMPVGNGTVGLNVWVESNGDLLFLVGKTDSYDNIGDLLKLGRVRVSLNPNPFATGATFMQRLNLRNGEIQISGEASGTRVDLRVWVDANHPVVHVKGTTNNNVNVDVELETWRTTRRQLTGRQIPFPWANKQDSFAGDNEVAFMDLFREADTIVSGLTDRIIWYHRNTSSVYEETLNIEQLSGYGGDDPLLNRTFGAAILGSGMTNDDSTTLGRDNTKDIDISIYPYTAQTSTVQAWRTGLQTSINNVTAVDSEARLAAHRSWWSDFWNRHWIFVSADGSDSGNAKIVSQNYALSRFMFAAAARGDDAIHFNGSIFNVNWPSNADHPFGVSTDALDADYRLWGSAHWFQNIRFAYFQMLMAGNFDMMHGLFNTYIDALPLAKYRTRTYYNHDGAYFPETIMFWGSATPRDYGKDVLNRQLGWTYGPEKRYHWSGNIELSAIMLDYYLLTQDDSWLTDTALPYIHEIMVFFAEHYRQSDGSIRLEPSQGLETLRPGNVSRTVVNPTDKISGLHFVLDLLLELPQEQTTESQREYWFNMKADMPLLKTTIVAGKEVLVTSESHPRHSLSRSRNLENVDLYAAFPFRVYGAGKPDLELIQNTYEKRFGTKMGGWNQQPIHATMVGDTSDAKAFTIRYFKEREIVGSMADDAFRFPVFYGPSHDWVPNGPQAGNAMIALQHMLMRYENRRIMMFPAWPEEWNVKFKFHLPYRTVAQGEFRDGQVADFMVTPAGRLGDVEFFDFSPNTPVVSFDSPVEGGVFGWGRRLPYTVAVSDIDSGGAAAAVDCAAVSVAAYLVDGATSTEQSRHSGCTGFVTLPAEPADPADDELLFRLEASYTDADALTGTAEVTLHPNRKQAEHYDFTGGGDGEIRTENESGRAADGDTWLSYYHNGDYFGFSDVNLSGVTAINIRVALGAADRGPAKIEVRAGSATGHLVGEVAVVPTGAWADAGWRTVTISTLNDPGGTNALYFVGVNTSGHSSPSIGNVDWVEFAGDGISTDPPTGEPVVSFDSPVEGGVFGWGRRLPYTVAVSDIDSGGAAAAVDCAAVSVAAYLVDGATSTEQSRHSGCTGFVTLPAEPADPADDELLFRLEASYTDADALTGTAEVTLHPNRKQAEHYDFTGGGDGEIRTENESGRAADGDTWLSYYHNGDYFGFSDVNLSGVTAINIRVALGAADRGPAKIEVRAGSATGHLVGEVAVVPTGAWADAGWRTVTISTLNDPGGTNALYFVGVNTSGHSNPSIGNVDWVEFAGDGVSTR